MGRAATWKISAGPTAGVERNDLGEAARPASEEAVQEVGRLVGDGDHRDPPRPLHRQQLGDRPLAGGAPGGPEEQEVRSSGGDGRRERAAVSGQPVERGTRGGGEVRPLGRLVRRDGRRAHREPLAGAQDLQLAHGGPGRGGQEQLHRAPLEHRVVRRAQQDVTRPQPRRLGGRARVHRRDGRRPGGQALGGRARAGRLGHDRAQEGGRQRGRDPLVRFDRGQGRRRAGEGCAGPGWQSQVFTGAQGREPGLLLGRALLLQEMLGHQRAQQAAQPQQRRGAGLRAPGRGRGGRQPMPPEAEQAEPFAAGPGEGAELAEKRGLKRRELVEADARQRGRSQPRPPAWMGLQKSVQVRLGQLPDRCGPAPRRRLQPYTQALQPLGGRGEGVPLGRDRDGERASDLRDQAGRLPLRLQGRRQPRRDQFLDGLPALRGHPLKDPFRVQVGAAQRDVGRAVGQQGLGVGLGQRGRASQAGDEAEGVAHVLAATALGVAAVGHPVGGGGKVPAGVSDPPPVRARREGELGKPARITLRHHGHHADPGRQPIDQGAQLPDRDGLSQPQRDPVVLRRRAPLAVVGHEQEERVARSQLVAGIAEPGLDLSGRGPAGWRRP